MRRIALVAVVLAAGCGGGGESLSREEYVAELDRICAELEARQDEIGEPQTAEEVVEKGPRLQEEFAEALRQARDLGEPPAEIAADVERFLEIGDRLHAGVGELVAAVGENDLARAQELGEQLEGLDQESDEIATGLGAERCATD